MVSTLVTSLMVIIAQSLPAVFDMRFIYFIISGAIDSTVNIICLTMQYSFAASYYRRYCS